MRNLAITVASAIWLLGAGTAGAQAAGHRVAILAGTVLDGKGGKLRDVNIVVEGAKIVAVEPRKAVATGTSEARTGAAAKGGTAEYDLRGLTVLPGWIDAHAHVTWVFGKDG